MQPQAKKSIPHSPKSSYDPQWDKFESTYYWKFHLDFNHPENRVPSITGYSKKEYQREAQDKVSMLKVKIINLFQKGYFNRMTKWEISQRVGEYINMRTDPCILILKPRTYEIPQDNFDTIFKTFAPFLDEFYKRIERGMSMEGIIKQRKAPANSEDFLDPEKIIHKLPTVRHLYSYMIKLKSYGHADGAIHQFYMKVKELKRW